MCGRFGCAAPEEDLQDRFDLADPVKSVENYNIAPGQSVLTITRNSPNNGELMRWGFVPSFSSDPSRGVRPINARAETIDRGIFRESFSSKRCLIPASFFYEWLHDESKQPYCFFIEGTKIFSFAGLYSVWKDAEDKELKTFTIITTSANGVMKPIHNRMPVILNEETEDKWLDSKTETMVLLELLKPFVGAMKMHPVSKAVNSPRNNGKELIEEMETSG